MEEPTNGEQHRSVVTLVEANTQKQAILEARNEMSGQFVELARWVVASLLAVNSGALLTVLNADVVSLTGKFYSGIAFALGVCFALLTGYANMRSARAALPEINKQLGYWIGVSLEGQRNEEIENELVADWQKASRADIFADAFGWLSFILLIVGLVVGGANLVERSSEGGDHKQIVEIVVKHD